MFEIAVEKSIIVWFCFWLGCHTWNETDNYQMAMNNAKTKKLKLKMSWYLLHGIHQDLAIVYVRRWEKRDRKVVEWWVRISLLLSIFCDPTGASVVSSRFIFVNKWVQFFKEYLGCDIK